MDPKVIVLKKTLGMIYEIVPFLVSKSIIKMLEVPCLTELLEFSDTQHRQLYPLGFERGSRYGGNRRYQRK